MCSVENMFISQSNNGKQNQNIISIIIPVYNVKDYIKDCVDSILCQTYKDYEVIR